MKEADLESRLVRGVKKLGGQAFKFVSPGNAGVPDRLVILPGGRIYFVELKTDRGRLSPMQGVQLKRLHDLGASVVIVRGELGVREILQQFQSCGEGGDAE